MRGERKMDFGVTGKLGGCCLAEQYRKKKGVRSFCENAGSIGRPGSAARHRLIEYQA